jgi:hypothetical protein
MGDPIQEVSRPPSNGTTTYDRWRLRAAALVTIAVLFYLVCVISGRIDEKQRLGAGDAQLAAATGLLVFLILSPEFFSRMKSFKGFGVEFEMLQEVRDAQIRQEQDLKSLRYLLSKGLSPLQLFHFMMLGTGGGENYKWDPGLKSDVRRLIVAKLVVERPPHSIDAIADYATKGLREVLELTPEGRAYFDAVVADVGAATANPSS